MRESATSHHDVPLEAAMPEGVVPLESLLCTEEWQRRPWRPPDDEQANRALVALAIALADSPRTMLHTLAETALEVVQADSAGLSLPQRPPPLPPLFSLQPVAHHPPSPQGQAAAGASVLGALPVAGRGRQGGQRGAVEKAV